MIVTYSKFFLHRKFISHYVHSNSPLLTHRFCLWGRYGVSVWMTSHEPHTADKVRAQDAEARWSESDPLNPGMLRDWNDELQTLRDLECATESDRLLRDRALYVLGTLFCSERSN